MITVAELIAKLQQLPAHAPVVTPGFDETGYEDIEIKSSVAIRELAAPTSYSGKYEDADRYSDQMYVGDIIEAVEVSFS